MDDLLDVARITQGKVSIRTRPVNLSEIVQNAVECVRPLIERREHHLTVRLPRVPLQLNGDPERLEQVVANLLTNAARYTEPGGRIELAVEAADTKACLRVRDSGAGIAPDMLEGIFEPFRQSGHTSHLFSGGMGIGLALARNLVVRHGGSIEARSEGVGQGSEFVVYLPLLNDERGTMNAESPQPEHGPLETSEVRIHPSALDLHPLKVLIIDDNTSAAETLAELLELWGYAARTGEDGARGLAIAGEWEPDVVLLDLQMPAMDGYEVARRLRATFDGRPLRIIALTGCAYDVAERVRAAGFDEHVLKPVELDALRCLLHGTHEPLAPGGAGARVSSLLA